MSTNYHSNNPSPCLRRCVPVICLLMLLLVGMPGANAQTAIRATPTSIESPALRANGKIAFTSDRDGNREIYVMNADGTNQVRLTNNSVVDDHATWSPDGTKIAFVSERPTGGFALSLMNADGTNKTEITPITFDSTYPIWDAWSMSWSPDGNRIVFQDSAYPSDILIVNIDGSDRHVLINGPGDEREPSWSPDGSRILFSYQVSLFFHHFHTVKPDGTDLQALGYGDGETDLAASWSPTGNMIAFQIFDYANWEYVAVANADGSNRQWFASGYEVPGDGGCDKPDWSPDGAKIVFHVALGSSTAQIYVKNVDGTGLTRLTDQPGNNFKPSWQSLAPAACANPIDCAGFFIRQHYLDFLNREPDAVGLSYWTDQITACGSDASCVHNKRLDVSAEFFMSLEFQQTGSFVYGLYKGALGRQPNYAEFTADHNRVIGGTNLDVEKAALANDFVQLPEFLQHYPGSLTNTEFVNALFDTAGLVPFTAERQAEIDAMNNQGRTRAQVLRNVVDIQAFRDREFNPSFVLMQYFGYLRRDIEPTGYNFWLGILNSTGDHRGMVCSFLTSAEYQLRFGPVTHSNAECGP